MTKLTPRQRKLIIQFLEYMVGGGVYFWSGYVVFAALYSGFGVDWLWAKMVADAIGWTLNFLIQRYWAFNDPRLRNHNVEVTGRYVAITVANFIIDYAIIASLKYVGVSPYTGFFISSGFFTVWNYFWYRFWVFKPRFQK